MGMAHNMGYLYLYGSVLIYEHAHDSTTKKKTKIKTDIIMDHLYSSLTLRMREHIHGPLSFVKCEFIGVVHISDETKLVKSRVPMSFCVHCDLWGTNPLCGWAEGGPLNKGCLNKPEHDQEPVVKPWLQCLLHQYLLIQLLDEVV